MTLTTIIGNSFNGTQSFASMTKHRWIGWYHLFTMIVIFVGALAAVPLVWEIVNFLIIFIVVPHLLGVTILAFKKPKVLEI